MFDTMVDGQPVKSPDHPTLPCRPIRRAKLPVQPQALRAASRAWRSRRTATKLYALLEGALYKEDGTKEMADGQPALRIIEFDVAKGNGPAASGSIRFAEAATRSATST